MFQPFYYQPSWYMYPTHHYQPMNWRYTYQNGPMSYPINANSVCHYGVRPFEPITQPNIPTRNVNTQRHETDAENRSHHPTLRSIEIRTQSNDGTSQHNEIPMTDQAYQNVNRIVSQLVEQVQNPETEEINETEENNETEDLAGDNDENVPLENDTSSSTSLSILDLQNHTQLEYFPVSDPQHTCLCSICHNSIEGHIVRVLRCSHTFHHDCIDRWLHSVPNCPMCRQSILPGEEEHMV